MQQQVARAVRFDRVDRGVVGDAVHRVREKHVRRRKESAVTVDEVLPVERREVHVGRVVLRRQRELEERGGGAVAFVADDIAVSRGRRQRHGDHADRT